MLYHRLLKHSQVVFLSKQSLEELLHSPVFPVQTQQLQASESHMEYLGTRCPLLVHQMKAFLTIKSSRKVWLFTNEAIDETHKPSTYARVNCFRVSEIAKSSVNYICRICKMSPSMSCK